MDEVQLTRLVRDGFSQREIGNQLACSQSSVKYWLKKLGLKTSKKSRALLCRICGEADPDAFYHYKDGRRRYRCRRCDNQEAVKRFRSYKKAAVDYKGGCCQECGYKKCLGSLDFHHLDSEEKDPDWNKMRHWPLERIKEELDKCVCLCRNCHGELHYEGD